MGGEDRMMAGVSTARASVARAPLDSRRDAETRRAHWSATTQGRHTESPLPLWERDRVRGLAPAGAEESIDEKRPPHVGSAHRLADSRASAMARSFRAAARVPSPCPSSTRGEGTLLRRLASAIAVAAIAALAIAVS